MGDRVLGWSAPRSCRRFSSTARCIDSASCSSPTSPSVLFNIPFAKVKWPDGTVHDGSPHKSLRRFQSSDHAYRDFCPTCGASVLYGSTRQPGLLDIAFGWIRAEDGALAKSWFTWALDKIAFPEEAVDQDLVKTLQDNLESIQKA